ncbi:LysR family transcriptional regulator [Sphingobium sp.]|uniref:LysR family transcriptional regulator n=1 Tax=Sphingobium sp. TaxID=1912891 RepID=UPI0035C6FF13
MDFRKLRYFEAVATERNLRKGAERLHVAQSALSRRIAELEQELGVPLFDRLPRGLRLRPSGEVLLAHARRIIADVEQARSAVEASANMIPRTIRIGLVSRVGQMEFITRAFRDMSAAFPSLSTEMPIYSHSTAVLDRLSSGDLDIGLMYRPVPDDDHCRSIILREFQPMVVLPNSHPLTQKELLTPDDINGEEFLLFPRRIDPSYHTTLVNAFHAAGATLTVSQEIEMEEVRLGLVAAGMGLSVASSSLLERPHPAGIVLRPLADMKFRTNLVAAWRPQVESLVMDTFLAHCRTKEKDDAICLDELAKRPN